MSVDGFIADARDRVGPLFDWYVNGDVELVEGGALKVSQTSAAYVRPMWASIGAMVIGRHLFDITNGWQGSPPAGEHVIVVSHRPGPDDWHPEGFNPVHPRPRASYYFTDDVAMDVVPVAFGSGKRYFGRERLGAIAALQQESLTACHRGQPQFQMVALGRQHQRRQALQPGTVGPLRLLQRGQTYAIQMTRGDRARDLRATSDSSR